MELTTAQKKAMRLAIEGKGLQRLPGGYWVPWASKSEPRMSQYEYAATVTVRGLISRGYLVPASGCGNGLYGCRAVTVEWDAARKHRLVP